MSKFNTWTNYRWNKETDEVTSSEDAAPKMPTLDEKTVAKTNIGDYRVSTVFLAMPHRGGMFETMVFEGDGWSELYCERYRTGTDAAIGHRLIVEALQQGTRPQDLAAATDIEDQGVTIAEALDLISRQMISKKH